MKKYLIATAVVAVLASPATAAAPQPPSCDSVRQRLADAPRALELPLVVKLYRKTEFVPANEDEWESIDYREPARRIEQGIAIACEGSKLTYLSADVDPPPEPIPFSANRDAWCKMNDCKPMSLSFNRVAVVIYAYTGWTPHSVIAATHKLFDERPTFEASMKAPVDHPLPSQSYSLPEPMGN